MEFNTLRMERIRFILGSVNTAVNPKVSADASGRQVLTDELTC